ncbi:MAG: hypothetical protein ACREM2_07425 [Vulcanimicrobiaceae bacterium]
MTALTEALWRRALQAAKARGLLPANGSRLTPRELAAEVARRGEERLARLVDGWYYPVSFGSVGGELSDDEAARLVAELEAGVGPPRIAAQSAQQPVDQPAPQTMDCELCGFPFTPSAKVR